MSVRQHIVFLTGAGFSADSGLCTFRDSDGLWRQVDPMEFCTASALYENPEKVLAFYKTSEEGSSCRFARTRHTGSLRNWSTSLT